MSARWHAICHFTRRLALADGHFDCWLAAPSEGQDTDGLVDGLVKVAVRWPSDRHLDRQAERPSASQPSNGATD
jgi:hypothetical protein